MVVERFRDGERYRGRGKEKGYREICGELEEKSDVVREKRRGWER